MAEPIENASSAVNGACDMDVDDKTDGTLTRTSLTCARTYADGHAVSSVSVSGCHTSNEFLDANAVSVSGLRKRKGSSSCDDCSSLNDHSAVPAKRKRSSTVDIGELSHEKLKQACTKFAQFACCPNCSAVGRELNEVEGLKSVLWCTQCGTTFGLDDTINYYELMQALEQGQYEVEPCIRCGNADPNEFVLCERNDGSGDGEKIGLKCMKCSDGDSGCDSAPSSIASFDICDEDADTAEPDHLQISCRCTNNNPELFEVVKDHNGSIVSIQCWKCKCKLHVTPAVCICGNDQRHEFDFDEFGYVSKLVCKRCKAELDCGAKSAVPRVDSSGNPLGRSRVETLELLKPGDHIAWHQFLSYWHHAIVTNVDTWNNTITVVNYDGPNTHKGNVTTVSFACAVFSFVVS